MLIQQKNFQDFYNEIREAFPRIKQLQTWSNYDWSVNGCENSLIMSEVSIEMATWVSEGDTSDAQRLMDVIERYFHDGDVPVQSMIYTDFFVTIMESKKEPREVIKSMMGPETKKLYTRLLDFYREADRS